MDVSIQGGDDEIIAPVSAISPSVKQSKNSWGPDWGMDGYIYFSADIPNMCGIASYCSYPTM